MDSPYITQFVDEEISNPLRNPATDANETHSPLVSEGINLEEYSSGLSNENRVNQARLNSYKRQLSLKFLGLIRESEFEFGYDSAADLFIRERLAENALATKEWINLLFIENFHDVVTASGILRVLAHLKYFEIAPQGPTIALAALSHTALEVRECGIRVFENWETTDCLRILKSLSCPEQWMKDYVRQIITDLEELLRNVPIGEEDRAR